MWKITNKKTRQLTIGICLFFKFRPLRQAQRDCE
jgi:hypothetical protein